MQGRYDVVCPTESAWDLHRAWPEADLIITPDCGHSAFDPPNTRALVAATDRFAGRAAELRGRRAREEASGGAPRLVGAPAGTRRLAARRRPPRCSSARAGRDRSAAWGRTSRSSPAPAPSREAADEAVAEARDPRAADGARLHLRRSRRATSRSASRSARTSGGDMKTARKLGVTEAEIEKLCDRGGEGAREGPARPGGDPRRRPGAASRSLARRGRRRG